MKNRDMMDGNSHIILNSEPAPNESVQRTHTRARYMPSVTACNRMIIMLEERKATASATWRNDSLWVFYERPL